MLDINFIRENKKRVAQSAKNKGYEVDLDALISLDDERRELLLKIENLKTDQNKISRAQEGKPDLATVEKSRAIRNHISELEKSLLGVTKKYEELLLLVPNLHSDDSPIGKDESGNKELRKVGKPKKFKFKAKDHVELSENLNLMDNERAVKIGGTRSYITKNALVILEQAIIRLALDTVKKEGFEIMNAPVLVRGEALVGSGFFPFGKEDVYQVGDDLYLVGTSEASLVYYHAGETLTEKELPRLLSGVTTCFRKEVGTYGKDTRGVIRVHQFNKVEQVVLTKPDQAEKMFEFILGISERIVQSLELPYRIIAICSGDMGAKNYKQYDIEVWFPSQDKYRETHSCSWLSDYQARRSRIKYRDIEGKKHYVHTLNNTAIATPRIIAALIENHQNEDGSINIPDKLQKYTGFKVIK